ncbi:hypothetical protein GUITHDRAFT_138500 [Guillardia theta CCMP2712]|uniref:Uncharacterized protein n=1 Tax=Guillardia theta (strain CCMP2712) TaxID=905079 RepID=L1JBW3_GUITC|nr:hypothetical protein GUITHDRAFT_138500 [Guillardia theta CCMP2712]EKX46011.1 hypothetical protein GUITHDRAFT_138500 [Guillardia theta CCMP2712]|eukprot:XP_005832991.1 hypothetical protein GUITHDRAFT_138500 [Guillardia theta CCMP2712]
MGIRTRLPQIFLLLTVFILLSSSHPLEHEGCHEGVLLPSAMRGGYEPKGELRHGATVKGPRSWRGAKNQGASRRNYNARRQGRFKQPWQQKDERSVQADKAWERRSRIVREIQEEQMKTMKTNHSWPVEGIPIFIPRAILIQKYPIAKVWSERIAKRQQLKNQSLAIQVISSKAQIIVQLCVDGPMGNWLRIVQEKLANRYRQPTFEVHIPLLRVHGSVPPQAMLNLLRNFTRDLQEFRLSVTNQVYIDKAEYSSSRQLSLRISLSPEKDVEVLSGRYLEISTALSSSEDIQTLAVVDPTGRFKIQRHERAEVVGSCHFP